MSIERGKLNAIDKQRHEEPLATKNYDRLWIMNCIYTYLNDESYKWTKKKTNAMNRRGTRDRLEIYALNQSVIIISLYKVAFRTKIQKPRATSTRFP